MNEYEFQELAQRTDMTQKQKNAVAALRSILILRALSKARLTPSHYYFSGDEHSYESNAVARIVMETIVLVMAAFRGEFSEDWEPHIVKGLELEQKAQTRNQALKS